MKFESGKRTPRRFLALGMIGLLGLGLTPTGRKSTLAFRNSLLRNARNAADSLVWGTSTGNRPMGEQFRSDLRETLSQNRSSDSLKNWFQSGFLPSDVFENVHGLVRAEKMRHLPPRATEIFCGALAELQPQELALFQLELESTQDPLPCRSQELLRLENFWREKEAVLPSAALPALSPSETDITAATDQVRPLNGSEIPPGYWAITFSGGPHPSRTLRILSELQTAHWPANFFFVGERVSLDSRPARAARDLGNVIGTEGYSPYSSMKYLTLREATKEISKGVHAIASQVGNAPLLFRFPYGASTAGLRSLVAEQGLRTVSWNLDGRDWQIQDPTLLLEHLVSLVKSKDRGILILHDTLEQTSIVLPHLLAALRKRGIRPAIIIPKREAELASY